MVWRNDFRQNIAAQGRTCPFNKAFIRIYCQDRTVRNNAVLHTTRHARRQVTAVVSGTNQEDIRLMVFKEVC